MYVVGKGINTSPFIAPLVFVGDVALRAYRGLSSEAADTGSISGADGVKRSTRVDDDAGMWGLKAAARDQGGREEEGGGEAMAGSVEAPVLEPPLAGSVRHAYSP